jgi:hypothetical protein
MIFPAFGRTENQGAWGNVHGQVVLAGPIPDLKPLTINKDEKHCLAKGPINSQELVVNKANRGVRWAFVWLAPLEKNGPSLPIHPALKDIKEKQIVIDQPCCMFEPHALAIREGQEILAKNSAPVVHNTHWTGHPLKNPGANRSLPAGQTVLIDGLKADKYPVKVTCDLHPWMTGWIRVFDHPYFALTDADGNFEIKSAPVGKWRLVVWHEAVGWVTPRAGAGGEPGIAVGVTPGDVNVGKIEMKVPPQK